MHLREPVSAAGTQNKANYLTLFNEFNYLILFRIMSLSQMMRKFNTISSNAIKLDLYWNHFTFTLFTYTLWFFLFFFAQFLMHLIHFTQHYT